MKPARVLAQEHLPASLNLEDLAVRNGITIAEATRLIRVAEMRGQAFSRIDPETGRLRWYWV